MEGFIKNSEFLKRKFNLFLLPVFSILLFSQYQPEHKDLINTTYNRTFDKSIITRYLKSEIHQDVSAALLSISHSKDTSFVNEILRLDYTKYANEMVFTLGQLGYCLQSEVFIKNKLMTKTTKSHLLEAYSKIAKENIYKNIPFSDFYNEKGFYLSLVNLFNKKFITKKELTYLLYPNITSIDEKKISSRDQELNFYKVYALSRTVPDSSLINKLENLLVSNKFNDDFKMYCCSALRRLKYFPEEDKFLKLLGKSEYSTRIELVRMLQNYNLNNFEFLSLIYKNLNYSERDEFFKTLSRKSLNKTEISSLEEFLLKLSVQTKNTEQLFSCYTKFFPEKSISLYRKNYKKITLPLLFSVLKENKVELPDSVILSYKNFPDNNSLIAYADYLMLYQNKSVLLDNLILDNVKSPLSLICINTIEQIDSAFISKNKNIIAENIFTSIKNKINSPDFGEVFEFYLNYFKKYHAGEFENALNLLKSSDNLFVQNVLRSKFLNEPKITDASFSKTLTDEIFSYKFVEIHTTKGVFTIKFKPEIAPISVASFINLCKKSYFNNVVFHRVIPAFVAQTGDPSGTGWGGPGYEIVSEFSDGSFCKTAVGMASSGFDTEGSQWFVMTGHHPHLNAKYTIFGEVVKSYRVTLNLTDKDKILKTRLFN